jgi:hypothetical protein
MINVTDFGNHEMLLIELAFVSRAVCDLITTAGIAWSLRKKRNPDIKKYAYPSSRPKLLFLTSAIARLRWLIG